MEALGVQRMQPPAAVGAWRASRPDLPAQVALDDKPGKTPAVVWLSVGGVKTALGTLRAGTCDQFSVRARTQRTSAAFARQPRLWPVRSRGLPAAGGPGAGRDVHG